MQNINEITDRILLTYSSCKSYQDEGFADSFGEDGHSIGRIKFKTMLVPPYSFRFEFSDPSWNDGKQKILCVGPTSTSSNIFDCESDTSLLSAIASIHGVSRGAASLVSTLVFEELIGLLKNTILKVPFDKISSEQVGEVDCFALTAKNGDKLASGKQDSLIRFAKRQISTNPTNYVSYEITSVKINEPLPKDLFQMTFEPGDE